MRQEDELGNFPRCWDADEASDGTTNLGTYQYGAMGLDSKRRSMPVNQLQRGGMWDLGGFRLALQRTGFHRG